MDRRFGTDDSRLFVQRRRCGEEGSRSVSSSSKISSLLISHLASLQWHEGGGILIMGYEMYRLLNYASDATVKTPVKKSKTKNKSGDDDDGSDGSDQGWLNSKKTPSQARADAALINSYRKATPCPSSLSAIRSFLQGNIFGIRVPI